MGVILSVVLATLGALCGCWLMAAGFVERSRWYLSVGLFFYTLGLITIMTLGKWS